MAEQIPRAALDHSLLGAALANLRDSDAPWAEKFCLIFAAFTCARSGEARRATWDEVDMVTSIWTIPGSRMKTDTLHRVPLSTQAKEVLTHAKGQTDAGDSRIFPPKSGEYIKRSGLSLLLKKLEIQTVPHGFRASFRNWAGEQGDVSPIAAEMSLAHRPTTRIERELMTSDLLEERQALMQLWADFLTDTMGDGHTHHRGVARAYVNRPAWPCTMRSARLAEGVQAAPPGWYNVLRTIAVTPPRGLVSLVGSMPGSRRNGA